MFLAAMRHILTLYGAEVRGALALADSPLGRVRAVLAGACQPSHTAAAEARVKQAPRIRLCRAAGVAPLRG